MPPCGVPNKKKEREENLPLPHLVCEQGATVPPSTSPSPAKTSGGSIGTFSAHPEVSNPVPRIIIASHTTTSNSPITPTATSTLLNTNQNTPMEVSSSTTPTGAAAAGRASTNLPALSIAGVAIGSITGLIMLFGGIIFLLRRRCFKSIGGSCKGVLENSTYYDWPVNSPNASGMKESHVTPWVPPPTCSVPPRPSKTLAGGKINYVYDITFPMQASMQSVNSGVEGGGRNVAAQPSDENGGHATTPLTPLRPMANHDDGRRKKAQVGGPKKPPPYGA